MASRINLSNLKPAPGARRKMKRIGRGPGSGHGKTATAGHKGQLSRSGRKQYAGFEGGQMPLHRRIPKRGFTNIFRKVYAVVNVGDLDKLEGPITPEGLLEAGLKVLGDGDIRKALVVRAHRFSKQAVAKIVAAGGKAELLVKGSDAAGAKRA